MLQKTAILFLTLLLASSVSAYQDEYPPQPRVVAFGDIHADFLALTTVLQTAKVLKLNSPLPTDLKQTMDWVRNDSAWTWIGEKTYVVQTGDQVDFGGRDTDSADVSQEKEIIEFMDRLSSKARNQGGNVISMFGNHEFMNVEADFRYVTPKGMKDYGGEAQRTEWWKIGNDYLAFMAMNRPLVVKIGNAVFCHGGIEPQMALVNISTMNYVFRYAMMNKPLTRSERQIFDSVTGGNGPLWSRKMATARVNCRDLQLSLDRLKANVMVIGHTPDLKVRNYCDRKVFVIDTMMSRAFGLVRDGDDGSTPRFWALEITNGNEVRYLTS